MFFAGFALFLNGVSYYVAFNRKILGYVNLFAAFFIIINTTVGLEFADGAIENYANAAAAFAFALNFLIIGIHHVKGADDFVLFGWFSFLMSLVSIMFVLQSVATSAGWLFVYLWAMWAVLWGQAFVASALKVKAVDKLSPLIVIVNSIGSLIAPAILLLFGVLP